MALEPNTTDPGTNPRTPVTNPAIEVDPNEKFQDSTILIVDDNEQNLELLLAYLEPLGCELKTAADGIQAIEQIAETNFDCILLDVMMPRMSGFEVCKKLKDDPTTRSIPIIMVTALNELGDIERGVQAGADDFITKPVKKPELVKRVQNMLKVRHLKRELERTEAYRKLMGDGGE